MSIPGVVYSLLLAVGAWAVEYFTTGAGGGVPWAPILVAAIPIIIKLFTVSQEPGEPPAGVARSMGEPGTPQRSTFTKLLLG